MVSIITPMFNSEVFIADTIQSILKQTYTNWELILIDDNSNDNTLQIVEPFRSQNPNIKLLKNTKNQGAALSRNLGIKAAKGKFIAFLDADDLWKPNKLQTQIEFMELHACDVCFASYDLINEQGKPLNKRVKALPVLTYQKLLKSNYLGNLTGMYNAKVLGEILAPNLRKRQDWLLWLAAIKKSDKPALGIEESLAFYRVRTNALSSNKLGLLKYNYWVYKKGLGFSTKTSIFCMLHFLVEHFFVKSKQIVTINKI